MTKAEKAKLAKDPEGFVKELIAKQATEMEAAAKKHAAELKAAAEKHAAEKQELTEEIEAMKEAHAEELEQAKGKPAKKITEIPGVYTAEDGRKFMFKPGYAKTRLRQGKIVDSKDLIKKADLKEEMEHLIAIGYGGLKEVNKKK